MIVRDRIICATISPRVCGKLLSQGPELTLEKEINIARSHKSSERLWLMAATKYMHSTANLVLAGIMTAQRHMKMPVASVEDTTINQQIAQQKVNDV